LKYSASLFEQAHTTLDQAEEAALASYCQRAQLQDGQDILEIGCGWGSLSLYMAEHYPKAHITVVSNSSTQRQYIQEQARLKKLENLTVITCDVNVLQLEPATFDRVVSVEMFEHVRNYQKLFENISSWLKADGLMWCHIFCHRFLHYPFEVKKRFHWMSNGDLTSAPRLAASHILPFWEKLQLDQYRQRDAPRNGRTANAALENMV